MIRKCLAAAAYLLCAAAALSQIIPAVIALIIKNQNNYAKI